MTPSPDDSSQTTGTEPTRSARTPRDQAITSQRIAARAALAIAVLWGGILVIAAVERRLPEDQMWFGHAAVHLWTATVAGFIAAVALQISRRDSTRILTALLRITVGVAAVTSVSAALEVVGAYPTLRHYHDLVDTVAEPVGWVLLGVLLAVAIAGLRAARLGSRRIPQLADPDR